VIRCSDSGNFLKAKTLFRISLRTSCRLFQSGSNRQFIGTENLQNPDRPETPGCGTSGRPFRESATERITEGREPSGNTKPDFHCRCEWIEEEGANQSESEKRQIEESKLEMSKGAGDEKRTSGKRALVEVGKGGSGGSESGTFERIMIGQGGMIPI
jgi:hypothetical protein